VADQQAAQTALNAHSAELMAIPGVVGLGIGSQDSGNYVVNVYTATDAVAGVPGNLSIAIGGRSVSVPTKMITQGPVTLE
jgi:hypothetical protein